MGINHAPTGIVGPSQRQIAVIVQKGFVQIIRYHIGKASVLIRQKTLRIEINRRRIVVYSIIVPVLHTPVIAAVKISRGYFAGIFFNYVCPECFAVLPDRNIFDCQDAEDNQDRDRNDGQRTAPGRFLLR